MSDDEQALVAEAVNRLDDGLTGGLAGDRRQMGVEATAGDVHEHAEDCDRCAGQIAAAPAMRLWGS